MAVTEWKLHKLDELGSVGRGKSRHRPRNDPSLYGGEFPFFQTGDIKAAHFRLTEYSQTYNDAGLAQSKLWQPDTLCITIAANIADTAILGIPGCFPDSVVGFVADPEKADVRFIKYYIDTLKLQMQSVSRGTTQDNLSVDKLLTFDFHVPPLSIQHHIAGILSAFDDLIENNLRRIRILEEMARALYREWFVHFRFPGHETIPRVASPLGLIPKEWKVHHVTDFADFIRGIEPGSQSYATLPSDGLVRFLRVGDFSKRDSNIYVREELLQARLLTPEDIAITLDGSVGLVRLGLSGGYSSGIRKMVLRDPVRLGWSFAFQLLCSEQVQAVIHAHSKGTTIKHAGSAIEKLQFAVPPPSLMSCFETVTAPMLRQRLNLDRAIRNLRQTRDLLLPRLLSDSISFVNTEAGLMQGTS